MLLYLNGYALMLHFSIYFKYIAHNISFKSTYHKRQHQLRKKRFNFDHILQINENPIVLNFFLQSLGKSTTRIITFSISCHRISQPLMFFSEIITHRTYCRLSSVVYRNVFILVNLRMRGLKISSAKHYSCVSLCIISYTP